MMAGNPSWWSMNGMHPQSHHQLSSELVYGASNPSLSSNTAADHPTQDFPPIRSSNQLLLGGAEERLGGSLFERQRKLESWEDQVLNSNPFFTRVPFVNVKQEYAQSSCQLYEDEFQANRPSNCWPHHQVMPVCPPNSCTAILSNSILNFSGGKAAPAQGKKHGQHSLDHLSECNRASTGGVSKKARVQHSSAQPALKVRKEKLGDRITALHQLVSPFGKTDTASVLSEAILSIRFLHGQIQMQALSSPYMRNAPGSAVHHQHSDSERDGGVKDLRSRGLCLVPISCTQNVGNDVSAADFWDSATFGAGPF